MSAMNRVSRWGVAIALASLMVPGTAGAADQTGGTRAAGVSQEPGENVVVGSLAARFDDTLRGAGVVAEGASFSGRGDGVPNTSAAITIAGIPAGATVQRALLYWMIFAGSDTTAIVNGTPVTGVQVGVAGDVCWGTPLTPTFRADVTSLVSGNGTYTVAGLPSSLSGVDPDTNGVALVVVYQDPASGIVRRVLIRDGAISSSGGNGFVRVSLTCGSPGATPMK